MLQGVSVFWDTSKKREEQEEAVGRGSQVARVLSVTDQGVGGAAVPFTRWVDCLQISLARCSYQDEGELTGQELLRATSTAAAQASSMGYLKEGKERKIGGKLWATPSKNFSTASMHLFSHKPPCYLVEIANSNTRGL